MRWMVTAGSMITRSPVFTIVLMAIFFLWYWSAIRGATLDLMPPVPIPMIRIAATKPPIPAPFSSEVGSDVKTRMSNPTM